MILFAGIAALILYASLYPWHFVAVELSASPLWILLHSWNTGPHNRRFISDVLVNVFLYIPLGASAWLAFRRHLHPFLAAMLAISLGIALSASAEMLQLFIPGRDCSALDLTNNSIGTALGVLLGVPLTGIRRERLGRLRDRPAASLLALWLASVLFPFFPVTRFGGLTAGFRGFVMSPVDMPAVIASALMWCVAGFLMARTGVRLAVGWLAILMFVLLPMQFVIVSHSLSRADVAGAVCGLVLFAILRRVPGRYSAVAGGVTALLVWRGLTPFHFATVREFVWIPFGGSLESGDWQNGIRILLNKLSLYGSAIWLVRRAGVRYSYATAAVASVLGCIEVAQIWIPEHVAEITDPLLAGALGTALNALDRK